MTNFKRWMILCSWSLAPLISQGAALPGSQSERVVNAADFGLKEGTDNTPALTKAIQACKTRKATRLVIPKGIYDIFPEKAAEAYRSISNNDAGKKRIVFLLEGFDHFEIDGSGSKFICHDNMVPFDVSNSTNITLRNFSVDWAAPFYLQAQVLAVHPELNAFDIRIFDECSYEIQGADLIFSNKKAGKTTGWYSMAPCMQKDVIWEQNINWNIWYDPATKAPAYCNENDTRVNAWNFKLNKRAIATELEHHVVRLTNAADTLPKVGWVLICNGILSKNRLSPAIHISHCKQVQIEQVTVHHAAGMALIAERSENITLHRYNVTLPEGSGRFVTSTADASHFVGCGGTITLDSCIFENMLDDGTNVHGIYAEVEEAVDSYTLGMTRGHSQQQGFDFARVGEKVRLADRNTLKPYATLTVAAVRNVNDFYFEVTFKEKVTPLIRKGSVAENRSCQPDVVMRHCEVRQNRARGILISTAGKVLIEKNRFLKCTYAGIQTAGDANYWFESGPVADLVIRDNLFEDQGLAVGNAPALVVVPEVHALADSAWYYHRNIIMENNTINTFSRIIVEARSLENFVFRGNSINKSTDYPVAEGNGPSFVFSGCKNIRIEKNKYNQGGIATIEADNKCVQIRSRNNENIEER